MEKLKTLNNSCAKDYFTMLATNNFRASSYLIFNFRELFVTKVYYYLINKYFEHFECDIDSLKYGLKVANVDWLVTDYIIHLYYQWKGGVYRLYESLENLRKGN